MQANTQAQKTNATEKHCKQKRTKLRAGVNIRLTAKWAANTCMMHTPNTKKWNLISKTHQSNKYLFPRQRGKVRCGTSSCRKRFHICGVKVSYRSSTSKVINITNLWKHLKQNHKTLLYFIVLYWHWTCNKF